MNSGRRVESAPIRRPRIATRPTPRRRRRGARVDAASRCLGEIRYVPCRDALRRHRESETQRDAVAAFPWARGFRGDADEAPQRHGDILDMHSYCRANDAWSRVQYATPRLLRCHSLRLARRCRCDLGWERPARRGRDAAESPRLLDDASRYRDEQEPEDARRAHPVPDAESLPFHPSVLKLVVCMQGAGKIRRRQLLPLRDGGGGRPRTGPGRIR